MTKEKIYDILTAGLLVCTGLTDFGGYIVYDIYHIMKNGGWYRGFLFHDLMLEICIGPALFILCGVFRFLKMRKANVLMSFAMFVYHVVNYYPNPVFVYRLTNLMEIIGIAGFLFCCFRQITNALGAEGLFHRAAVFINSHTLKVRMKSPVGCAL